MINYLIGKLVVKDPTYVVVETKGGVGYEAKISLATYGALKDLEEIQLFTHLHVKEDAHTLYGFAEPGEKKRFIDLISISGVGPSTGLMILSSLSPSELQSAIAKLKGQESPLRATPEFNHPIDWKLLNDLTDQPKAQIKTAKGDITIRLLPREAPGSVANFINLAREGFYDGKNFHRIVANFVIQGGCPRGDGYGSLDYSIRSELSPLHYDQAGYVGMASAGNHTEGTQFFITHSPTPHLDGNYTIFGLVTEGIDIVHGIELGDIIDEIRITR